MNYVGVWGAKFMGIKNINAFKTSLKCHPLISDFGLVNKIADKLLLSCTLFKTIGETFEDCLISS